MLAEAFAPTDRTEAHELLMQVFRRTPPRATQVMYRYLVSRLSRSAPTRRLESLREEVTHSAMHACAQAALALAVTRYLFDNPGAEARAKNWLFVRVPPRREASVAEVVTEAERVLVELNELEQRTLAEHPTLHEQNRAKLDAARASLEAAQWGRFDYAQGMLADFLRAVGDPQYLRKLRGVS